MKRAILILALSCLAGVSEAAPPNWPADAVSSEMSKPRARIVGRRPPGCPRRFCGCALSIRVFGRSVRKLWLARNWLTFPRTSPRPGMVAARRGHVMLLRSHVAGNRWVVFDPNSGGGRTRIHVRSIARFVVVNPNASAAAEAR